MKISLVIPVYNEQTILAEVLQKYKTDLQNICSQLENTKYEIIAVNDGCTDGSVDILLKEGKLNRNLRIVNFDQRYGKQAAITAGMETAQGDVIILADVDLLNPIGVFEMVVSEYLDGCNIVYAYREALRSEGFKRAASDKIVSMAAKIFGVEGKYMGKANIQLFSRAIADVIISLPAKNKYLRTMNNWVGFEITEIEYASGFSKEEISRKIKTAKALDKQQGQPEAIRSKAREHTPSLIYSMCGFLLSAILMGTWVILGMFVGINLLIHFVLLIAFVIAVLCSLMLLARAIMIKRIGIVHNLEEPIFKVESIINKVTPN